MINTPTAVSPEAPLLVAKLALLAVACVWGTSYGLTKEALLSLSVFAFLSLRFAMTFLLTLPFVWREMMSLTLPKLILGLGLGCILFSIFCAETFGVLYLDASLAAVLISLCIVMTPILERYSMQTSISRQLKQAIPISLLGILMICSQQISHWSFNHGTWLILLAALLRAIMSVATKASFNRFSFSPIMMTSLQAFVVTLGSLSMLFFSGSLVELSAPISLDTSLILLYLVVFCTLFAFMATNFGIKHAGPAQASFLMGLEPVFGVLFAVLWLSESLSLMQWLGCGLVVFSTYLVLVKPKAVQ